MTRREFVTSGLGLAGIISAGKCPAYIKSLMGATNTSIIGSIVKPLPYKRELQWIQDGSGHKAQISTTLKPENNHIISWKASPSVTSAWQGIGFNTWASNSTEMTYIQRWNTENKVRSFFRTKDGTATVYDLDLTIDHEFKMTYGSTYVDGIYFCSNPYHMGTSDDRMPYQKIGFYSRLWYFKVEADGKTLIHLKPVVDENDVVCMYDTVSGELFYSEGGTFEAGPDRE